MDAKTLVGLAFEDMTPDAKVALMCKLCGKDPDAYDHLDTGRKSMTAGNVLRAAAIKDPAIASALQKHAGLDEEPLSVPVATSAPAPTQKARPSTTAARPEPIEADYPRLPNGQHMVPMGCGAFFALDVIGKIPEWQ